MTKISALSSATPGTTALLVSVVNSTTVKVTAQDIVNVGQATSTGYITSGAMLYGNQVGALAELVIGAAGQILEVISSAPTWTATSNALSFTGAGSILINDSAAGMTVLAAPSSGAVLTFASASSTPSWSKPTSGSILTGNANGVPTWLAKGESSQALFGGGTPGWNTAHIGARLDKSASAAVSSGYVTVTFDTETYDSDNMITNGSTNAITVRTPGVYLAIGGGQLESSAVLGGFAIWVNSSLISEQLVNLTGNWNTIQTTMIKALASGAVIQLATFSQSTNTIAASKTNLAAQLLART